MGSKCAAPFRSKKIVWDGIRRAPVTWLLRATRKAVVYRRLCREMQWSKTDARRKQGHATCPPQQIVDPTLVRMLYQGMIKLAFTNFGPHFANSDARCRSTLNCLGRPKWRKEHNRMEKRRGVLWETLGLDSLCWRSALEPTSISRTWNKKGPYSNSRLGTAGLHDARQGRRARSIRHHRRSPDRHGYQGHGGGKEITLGLVYANRNTTSQLHQGGAHQLVHEYFRVPPAPCSSPSPPSER
jgi:hypothetical protein